MNLCLLLQKRTTPLNAQHTNKLFWGKYLYKVVLKLPRISALRYGVKYTTLNSLWNCNTLEEWLQQSASGFRYTYPEERNLEAKKLLWKNRFELYKFVLLVNEYNDQKVDIRYRYEGDTAGIYFNESRIYNELVQKLTNIIDTIVWPKSDHHAKFLLSNPTTELVKEYPYKKYQYKICLRNYKSIDNSVKENFEEWIKNYPDFKISEMGLKQIRTGFVRNGKFIYSTNTKDMLLLQMFLGDTIKEIINYKLEREIDANTIY